MSTILVVAAHPDDEILGVGATIASRVQAGDTAYAVILGEGQTSRADHREEMSQSVVEELHKDTLAAAKHIGFKEVYFENVPDNRFDQMDLLDVVKKVEKLVRKLQPDVIYTHHKGDLNIDHRITYQAVLTATRPMQNCPVQEIYTFETVSSTEWNFAYGDMQFAPNVFVDVTAAFQKKLDAMKEYHTELCEFPHPRSLKCLEVTAQRWGSVVGKEYVEPFELVRSVKVY